MLEFGRAEVLERLKRVDADAALEFDDGEQWRVVIVGGGALILLECISRATHDVDVLNAPSILTDLMARYDMNTRVKTYINNFPYNYEDRLVPVDIQTEKLKYYTASLEDIVIAKLCSYRPQDEEDVTSPDVLKLIDWDLLDKLANDESELRSAVLNDHSYNDFKITYNEYRRRYGPCGN